MNNFRVNKLELIDIFRTIEQLADDCVFEIDQEEAAEGIDQSIKLKVGRIYRELEVYDHLTRGGNVNE